MLELTGLLGVVEQRDCVLKQVIKLGLGLGKLLIGSGTAIMILLGAKNLGVDIGPDAFRYAGILEKLGSAGMDVRDEGMIHVAHRSDLEPGNPRLRYAREIIRVSNESAKLTEKLLNQKHRVIGVGGDHSMTLGLVSGASTALNGELGLIYFDAHGDMNTDKTTLSGNIHGMHLASLIGLGPPELTHVHTAQTKIAKENLLH
ncbi:Arginase/agmatinase/formiminoglutamase, partial [candidate division TM7 genomosp. GTL1]